MTSAPGLFARAVSLGLVSEDDVLSGRVSVTDQSRSNVVRRIDLDGAPVAFVKRRGAAAELDGDDPITAEARALAALAGVRVVPALVAGSASGVGPVSGDEVWTVPVDGIPLYAVHGTHEHVLAVARSWGEALAVLHQSVDADTLAAKGFPRLPVPWVFDPDRLPTSMGRPPEGSALAAVLDMARSAPVRALAASVLADWSPAEPVHGDLSAANVLVAEGAGGPTVRFIDVEGAGLGPAAWDLACALDTLGDLTRQWGHADVVPAFVAGYRAAGGPGRVVPAHLALRALVTGWQASAGLVSRGDFPGAWAESRIHLDRARHWLAVCERGAAREPGELREPVAPREPAAPREPRERGAA